MSKWQNVSFGEILTPNKRPYELGPTEDANLVGMRLYGVGPFHRELKPAIKIKKKSHFVIRSGDVIYNKLFAWKGTFGIVPDELDGMFVSDKFPTYEADQSRVHLDYLRWYFRYSRLWDQAKDHSKGAAALSKLTLNPSDFPKLTIPLPSLIEQKDIVDWINAVATRIDQAKTLRKAGCKAIAALRAAAISQVLDGLEFDGTLGDVLDGKPRNGWSAKCDGADGGVAVLSLAAVTGFKYRPDQFKKTSEPTNPEAHYWLNPGDLLITRSNTPELVGHAAIYTGEPSPCIYPDLIMRIPINPELCIPEFAHYVLQSRVVREYIRNNAKGTSPTMKKIAQGTVSGIPFPVCLSLTEQAKLVGVLERTLKATDELATLSAEVRPEMDCLIPSLLNEIFGREAG